MRIILSIFFPGLRIDKYPNRWRQYKGEVGPLPPKKWDKRDIRKYTTPVLAWSLVLMLWFSNKALNFTEYYDDASGQGGNSTEVAAAATQNSAESEESKFVIKNFTVEQIENLANTIAGQNAIWPGYKGDPQDHRAAQRHFNQKFAEFINSGIINVQPHWAGKSVAFAYAVTSDGIVVFVGAIPGGTITPDQDPDAYQDVSEGISGRVAVTPAQDQAGENIIMVYRIKVKFSIGY